MGTQPISWGMYGHTAYLVGDVWAHSLSRGRRIQHRETQSILTHNSSSIPQRTSRSMAHPRPENRPEPGMVEQLAVIVE
jgi:hypothetical protein